MICYIQIVSEKASCHSQIQNFRTFYRNLLICKQTPTPHEILDGSLA